MYAKQPAKYPIRAGKLILRKYQKKLIFSMPIAATPAADPIIKTLPPVPAAKAKNSQKKWSVG